MERYFRKWEISLAQISILLAFIALSECGTFNSTKERVFIRSHNTLSQLASKEVTVYALLIHYSVRTESIDGSLQIYLEDFEESSGQLSFTDETGQQKIADHPLLSYRMISRFVLQLTPILKDLSIAGMNDIVSEINASCGWPLIADLEDAMHAIVRLQHTYDIDIPELASGKILGSDTGFGLMAHHCFAIGNFAITKKYFDSAVEWLLHAKTLLHDTFDESIELEALDESIAHAMHIHDTEWDLWPVHESRFLTFKYETLKEFPELKLRRRTYYSKIWEGHRGINFNEINFWNLCSGEDFRTPEEISQLFCWYERKSSPAGAISPFKMEQLSLSPYLVQIYDLLPESVIQTILHEAQPGLRASPLYTRHRVTGEEEEEKLWNRRTSLVNWLYEENVAGLGHIPSLVESITGLVMSSNASEPLHLATYSFGSMYDVHHDVLQNESINWMTKTGDRIATFMFYLSDVEIGGYTAFPQAGIAARPVKGSGIFWYNMKRNGRTDTNAYHGACPVVLGTKWIATKWIRSNGQFLTRPCSVHLDD